MRYHLPAVLVVILTGGLPACSSAAPSEVASATEEGVSTASGCSLPPKVVFEFGNRFERASLAEDGAEDVPIADVESAPVSGADKDAQRLDPQGDRVGATCKVQEVKLPDFDAKALANEIQSASPVAPQGSAYEITHLVFQGEVGAEVTGIMKVKADLSAYAAGSLDAQTAVTFSAKLQLTARIPATNGAKLPKRLPKGTRLTVLVGVGAAVSESVVVTGGVGAAGNNVEVGGGLAGKLSVSAAGGVTIELKEEKSIQEVADDVLAEANKVAAERAAALQKQLDEGAYALTNVTVTKPTGKKLTLATMAVSAAGIGLKVGTGFAGMFLPKPQQR